MNAVLNHVSVLVTDVWKNAEQFRKNGYYVGEIESFDSEGTEEVYIGAIANNSKLLLQAPVKDGPYLKALNKRGVGLHHIALDVDDLLEFTSFMGKIGWLLHTSSLKNHDQKKAIYFARPGVNVLFEVKENKTSLKDNFIKTVNVPVLEGCEKFIDNMNIPAIKPVKTGGFSFGIDERTWTAAEFV